MNVVHSTRNSAYAKGEDDYGMAVMKLQEYSSPQTTTT